MNRRDVLTGLAGILGVSGVGSGMLYRNWTKQAPINQVELGEFTQRVEYDLCVVGSGPSGCIVADKLRKSYKRILLLESGYTIGDPSHIDKINALDRYSSSGEINYPLQSSRVRALGGTSNIWTGRCPRFLPTDFSNNPLAPNGRWPISYDELMPYYVQAEESLSVEGGPLNEFHAPRVSDLKGPRRDIKELESLLESVQIKVDYPPLSNKRLLFLEKGPIRFYRDYIPEISDDRNVDLVSGATVTKINIDDKGVVSSLDTQSVGGERKQIRAKKFVICAGAIESIRLLQLSGNSKYPGGIGNQSGLLGRYFMEHPWKDYFTTLPLSDEFDKNYLGRTLQYCNDFKSRGLGGIFLGFYAFRPNKMKVGLGIEMAPSIENMISLNADNPDAFGNPGADININFSPADEQLWNEGESIVKDIYDRLQSADVDKKDYIHWSHHHMGGTRMADHPDSGVVDKNLKVFNTENLYVVSSSVFVTSGVANPTLTIVALAHRLADHLGHVT